MENSITITKGDIIWSYVAKFFSLATGLIIMPFVLSMLSAEEVGMNYLMATVSSIVMLIDFGFGPQFGRNFSYVNSGAHSLLKEGIDQENVGEIDYHLLAVLLKTARMVYRRLSAVAFFIMLTIGSGYIYFVTDGFTAVKNALWIWIIYSVSVYFNFYYSYYTSLLTGSGMVAESSKATMLARIIQIAMNIFMLYMGCGLFSVVLSNLIAPFAQRLYCYKVYFTPELKEKLIQEISIEEIKSTFRIIWYNAKKIGVNLVGTYAINQLGMFLIGLYLALDVVGSYGLMVQITGLISGVAVIMTNSYMPSFSNLRLSENKTELVGSFSCTVIVFWLIMIVGGATFVFLGEPILQLIHSRTVLPDRLLCMIYILIIALEGNHSNFASFITTKNEVPFVPAALISGGTIAVLSFFVLQFTKLGLWGVVLVQGLVQLCYNNWYWPRWVIRDFNMSFSQFARYGVDWGISKIKSR